MSESTQIKLGVAVVVLFLFWLISSCSELRYIMRGVDVDAHLIEVRELKGNTRRGGPYTYVVAKYLFEDKDGTTRTEMDRVSSKFQPELGLDENGRQTVAIQYQSGIPNRSRLKGHDDMMWVYIFFGTIAAGAASVGWFLYTYYRT